VGYQGATNAAIPSSRLAVFSSDGSSFQQVPSAHPALAPASDPTGPMVSRPPLCSDTVVFCVVRCSLRLSSRPPPWGDVGGSPSISGQTPPEASAPLSSTSTALVVNPVVSCPWGFPSPGRSYCHSIACGARGGSCGVNGISSAHDRASFWAGLLASAVEGTGVSTSMLGGAAESSARRLRPLTLVPTSGGYRQAVENVG
jgi:hypothetical protein